MKPMEVNRASLVMLLLVSLASAAEVSDLRCEYRVNPLGIDAVGPRLGWVIEDRAPATEGGGLRQSAYQILVASSEELLKGDNGDLWDSGKVISDR